MSLIGIMGLINRPGAVPMIPVTNYNIMAKGDSLTADETPRQINGSGPFYAGFVNPWMHWLELSLNDAVKYKYFQNFATAGESILNGMDATVDFTEVANGKKYDVTKNILFLMAGVNDVQRDGQSPLNPAQVAATALFIYTDYKDLMVRFWGQGFTCCAFTMLPPRSAVWTDAQTAVMRDIAFELNDLIRAGFNTECKATVLCDIQTNPLMGLYDSNINHPEYFRPAPDKLHWTELGADEMSAFPFAAMPFLESGTVQTIIYNDLV